MELTIKEVQAELQREDESYITIIISIFISNNILSGYWIELSCFIPQYIGCVRYLNAI